jgi:hypothetical protein
VAGAAHARPFQQATVTTTALPITSEAGRIHPSLTQSQFRWFDMDRHGFSRQ